MRPNALAAQVGVIARGWRGTSPDRLDRIGRDLASAGKFRIAQRPGLGHAAHMGHLLDGRELAPHLGSPDMIDSQPPVAPAPRRNTIPEEDVPAAFVVAGLALAARCPSVQTPVHLHDIRRVQARRLNRPTKLLLWWRYLPHL